MNSEQEQLIGRAIFREAFDSIVIVRPADLQVVDANPAFQRLTGRCREGVIGLAIDDLFEVESPGGLFEAIRGCPTILDPASRGPCFVRNKNGERAPVYITISRVQLEPESLALLVVRDVSEHERDERRERARQVILEQIATGQALPAILDSIVAIFEQESPDSRCAIHLLDESRRCLLYGSAPRLPDWFKQAIHGLEIGPTVGSCGAAAFTKKRVDAEDIETHPNWAPYRELARRAGVRSCWSDPIFSSSGEVLGTFAVFHSKPRTPSRQAFEAIALATRLASIAIERKQSEDAVRASQRMLWTILDNIPQGVFWKDRESRYLGCNRVVARAFGIEGPEAIVGKDDHHLPGLTREQAEFFIAKDRQVMEANAPELGIIEPATLADGTSIWMETNKIPMLDEEGRVVGILGTWQDITERKQAKEALEKSEERFRKVWSSAGDGMRLTDEQGTVLLVNEAYCRLVGLPPEALVGRSLAVIQPIERRDYVSRQHRERFLAGKIPTHMERELTLWNGEQVWFELTNAFLEGEPRLLLSTFRDILQRKRAEEAMRENESFLRLSQRVGKIGSWHWDLRTNRVRWSETMYQLYGLEFGQFDGTLEGAVRSTHPADLPTVRAGIQRLIDGGESHPIEFRVYRSDGKIVYLWGHGEVIRDAAGKPIQVIGTVMDISERKAGEEERRKLEAQLQHAQKLESLGVMAGGIAHDFNNLLTSILGYSDLALLELPPTSLARQYIGEAVSGAHRAAELTKQMLAYSGKGRFVVKPVHLSTLAEEMSRLVQISISKKCVLKYNLSSDLPAIDADAAQIRQVVMNLIINASEAVGDRAGLIALTSGVRHCDRAYLAETYLDDNLPEGSYVYLDVADNGCGMSEEHRAKIFDPFFTTKFTGRGLGLSAVLGIVRGHRGAIKCQSEPGKGTTFRVLFPATASPTGPFDRRDDSTKRWRGNGVVLIVDDEDSVRSLTRHMMEAMGFSVLAAADGREGVDVFRKEAERIRLVLLDLTMPHLDGEEAFCEMRRIRSDVRAILTSGYNEQTAASRFEGKGLAGFIQKPYLQAELTEIVRKALEG